MADWHTKESIRTQWAAAPSGDSYLDELLEVAKDQVLDRGTRVYVVDPDAEGDQIPSQYRMAQKMYARALHEASNSNLDAEAAGMGEYQVQLVPMSNAILDLISPRIARVG